MPGVIRGKRLAAACLGLVGDRGALALGIGLAEISRRLDCAAWASSCGLLGRGGAAAPASARFWLGRVVGLGKQ